MKKSVRIAAMALAGIMSISLFAGCGADKSASSSGDNSTATSSAADKKIKIGLSLPTLQEERWVRDKATMEEAAKKAGVEIAVQVANMDAAKQDSQVENLISQGINILILAPHDAKAAASWLQAILISQ